MASEGAPASPPRAPSNAALTPAELGKPQRELAQLTLNIPPIATFFLCNVTPAELAQKSAAKTHAAKVTEYNPYSDILWTHCAPIFRKGKSATLSCVVWL